MKRSRFPIGGFVLMGAMTGLLVAGDYDALDGATGHVFKVDPAAKSFELLKETEYDPKTEAGRSRFTIHWTDATTVTVIDEVKGFSGIKSPVMVEFHGIDDPNAKALREGKAFVARVAVLHPDAVKEAAGGIAEGGRKVTGWFTPDPDEASRSGTIRVDDREVPVSMRPRNWRIFRHRSLKPEQLAEGYWQATLHGAEREGRFVAGSMEVLPLEDPRATDDPNLPRVLVIGDSISMNYHEAAKAALGGTANYHRNEGNGGPSSRGVTNAELWLGNYEEKGLHWDVIQFNHGLHDLKQTYDKATDTFGDHAVPIKDYQANLEKEIAILKKTGARLIWCTTTPVPNDNKSQYARRKGEAKVFNEAAMEVMKRHPEILVTDLYSVVEGSPVFDRWRTTNDVHFYKPEEQKALGDAVAATIRKALEKGAVREPEGDS